MELFPASDEEQSRFIERIIDDCDYYLLIIGGRYGTTTAQGISYTEKEYDYAVGRGLKVIALLHEKPDEIPVGKSELDAALRAKLEAFRTRVSTGRLVRFWTRADELPGLVALSLAKTIKTYPALGWVRGDVARSKELLSELNELRKQNEMLRKELLSTRSEPIKRVENLAGLDENFEVHMRSTVGNDRRDWTISLPWKDIFASVAPYLAAHPSAQSVNDVLEAAFVKRKDHAGFSHTLDDQDFQTISLQLQTLGLTDVKYSKTTGGGTALFWSLTPPGERLMLQLRTVPSKK